MAGRDDPSELRIYGAEDDEETGMILDALERVSKRDDDAPSVRTPGLGCGSGA